MDRKILFRGQTRRFGEKAHITTHKPLPGNWVYGCGVFIDNSPFSVLYSIQNPDLKLIKIPVYTDTVGQFTGFLDKNGKEIFEGDILDFLGSGRKMDVRWNQETGGWEITDVGVPCSEVNHLSNTFDLGEIQVEAAYGETRTVIVGNIFDNPVPVKSKYKENGPFIF